MNSNFITYPHQELFNANYHSITRFSKITVNGKKGPIGGTAVDKNPKKALIKSIAESLDRRSSMLWFDDLKSVTCFDILEKKIVRLPKYYFSLNNNEIIRDTTGSAAHVFSYKAVNNAILELLQKNALIDIWYHKHSQYIDEGSVKLLISTIFKPSIHILAMKLENERVFFSMGSGFNIEEAKRNAKDELSVLEVQKSRFNKQFREEKDLKYTMDTSGQKKHFLEILSNSDKYDEDTQNSNLKSSSLYENFLAIDSLKSTTQHAYIRMLSNNRIANICVVRIIADNLINAVPYKSILSKCPMKSRMMLTDSQIFGTVEIPQI